MNKIIRVILLYFAATFISYSQIKVLSLAGEWKLEIGDNVNWSKPDFNDNNWNKIKVPAAWEDEGYYGYDGFAWYRQTFYFPSTYQSFNSFFISLGYIDDVDEVYFNGKLIGFSGKMPPRYETAYNAQRKYYLQKDLIIFNQKNNIAIRVYDSQLAGGIVSGNIGIYAENQSLPFLVDFRGLWRFKTGDNMQYKSPDFNDSKWNNIVVPKAWEDQGYRNWDGYGWYRKTFYLNNIPNTKIVVIVLGKIDDFDEVYLNGVLISNKKIENYDLSQTKYNEHRAYYVSSTLLKGKNTIAIRVLDTGGVGGIYEGPVGIVSLKDFVNYWKNKNK